MRFYFIFYTIEEIEQKKELKGARVWYLGLFCLFIDAVAFLMNHPP